mmetsp:Transcript_39135/g.110608  ORF Transcript_39135/g.110608 Transcript_39135/m.110608 type:complete len:529 (+) Transcript_39135:1-1587(+)
MINIIVSIIIILVATSSWAAKPVGTAEPGVGPVRDLWPGRARERPFRGRRSGAGARASASVGGPGDGHAEHGVAADELPQPLLGPALGPGGAPREHEVPAVGGGVVDHDADVARQLGAELPQHRPGLPHRPRPVLPGLVPVRRGAEQGQRVAAAERAADQVVLARGLLDDDEARGRVGVGGLDAELRAGGVRVLQQAPPEPLVRPRPRDDLAAALAERCLHRLHLLDLRPELLAGDGPLGGQDRDEGPRDRGAGDLRVRGALLDGQPVLVVGVAPVERPRARPLAVRTRGGPAGAGGPAAGPDCKRPRTGALHGGHAHDEDRLAVEQRAADAEIPCPPIARALVAVLTAKGTISGEELRAEVEKMETMETSLGERGRQVVARAWADEGFRRRLLQDANAACAELGIQASNANTPTRLVVVEQTPGEHHLICCTLCSCYPLSLLGPSPDWYKSREYRARAVREPRAVLREFGTELPGHVRVVVHDSTADCRYLVLPRRPPGTEGWPEERLRELVSRDSMLGVAVPGAAH